MTSTPFRLTPSTYFGIECRRTLRRSIFFIILVLAASLYAALFDLRWALVALMALFLVVPFVVFNIYYTHLLKPEAVRALSRQKVTVSPDCTILVEYLPADDSPLPAQTLSPLTIHPQNIISIYQSGAYIVVEYRFTTDCIQVIPVNAISVEDLATLLDFLSLANTKNK